RGLVTKGLPVAGKNDPESKDGDNDDQEGALNNTGAGVGPSEAHGGTEQQTPRGKPKQKDGPVVTKAFPSAAGGAPAPAKPAPAPATKPPVKPAAASPNADPNAPVSPDDDNDDGAYTPHPFTPSEAIRS